MNLTSLVGEVVSMKVNSGEEMIAKIIESDDNFITVTNPVSVAPGPQGLNLVPSMFTAEQGGNIRINTNNIALIAPTGDDVKMRYIEATTGLSIPTKKKLILG